MFFQIKFYFLNILLYHDYSKLYMYKFLFKTMNYVQCTIKLIEEFPIILLNHEHLFYKMHLKFVLLRTYFELMRNNFDFIKLYGSCAA